MDHYDVPAEIYDRLVAAGAHAVDGRELTRRLITSGLRVPLKERPSKVKNTLLQRWKNMLPGYLDLGEHLLEQWESPARYYHNSVHLLEMLTALDRLFSPATAPRVVLLAAWLHDIVYKGVPGQDERESADFARGILTPLVSRGVISQNQLHDVVHLILATVEHLGQTQALQSISTEDFLRFLDADMAILAAPAPRYLRYAQSVRAEYAHFSDEDFARGRAKILREFLGREALYLSQEGRALWQNQARKNLAAELEKFSA